MIGSIFESLRIAIESSVGLESSLAHEFSFRAEFGPALDWITRDAPGPVKEPKYHQTQGHYQDIYIYKKRKSCL